VSPRRFLELLFCLLNPLPRALPWYQCSLSYEHEFLSPPFLPLRVGIPHLGSFKLPFRMFSSSSYLAAELAAGFSLGVADVFLTPIGPVCRSDSIDVATPFPAKFCRHFFFRTGYDRFCRAPGRIGVRFKTRPLTNFHSSFFSNAGDSIEHGV